MYIQLHFISPSSFFVATADSIIIIQNIFCGNEIPVECQKKKEKWLASHLDQPRSEAPRSISGHIRHQTDSVFGKSCSVSAHFRLAQRMNDDDDHHDNMNTLWNCWNWNFTFFWFLVCISPHCLLLSPGPSPPFSMCSFCQCLFFRQIC